ncbi:uncharacterized protein N7477_002363 [Penicillium maclennaniae]|uniref:uncharacterized protein n=1 Tax=Penicillium maclennaniae TaxID=1343394 RepID=UPI002540E224|nr:uncharacterized protein N7477_002363 [Penicillium maclennaniae]KAJ5676730.1 hypothetical protein N7477_002363 [Penicillium maclennaniae]
MFNAAKEDPVTYLNKSQVYSLIIKDIYPPPVGSGPVRYRTYVRVSFDDKEQRSRPAAYWQLWNDGRATCEAPRHGGKLHALVWKPRPLMDSASLGPDIQTPEYPECVLGVRFNFLSTDFSHSKGVKGASVRLCVKTEMMQPDDGTFEHQPEICFCKVKLFRDHGAERKLANDAAHVNKTIEKLKKQVFEAGASDGSNSEKTKHFPMKIAKRYRKSRRGSSEKQITGGLQAEIDALQRMFFFGAAFPMMNIPRRLWQQWPVVFKEMIAWLQHLRKAIYPAVARIMKAVDIDAGYSPPENAPRSVACFYVRFTRNGNDVSDYYHALYLTERTVRDLLDKISMKQQIDPLRVVRVLHMKQNGLRIIVDDEVVREFPEGQDMIVELSEVSSDESDGGVELTGTEVKLIF